MNNICEFQDCSKEAKTKNLCLNHYNRKLRLIALNNNLCIYCKYTIPIQNKKACANCEEKNYKSRQRYAIEKKLAVFNHYCNNNIKCNCCEEKNLLFLTIDHMNNDGTNHRRELGINSSTDLYIWLIHSDFPKEFQVLCMNCNFGKRMNDGICPHKDLDSIKRYLTFNKKRKYDNLAKLTKEDAADIKIRLTKGESVLSIASKYKLSSKTIKLIKSNRLWVNIPWPEN